MTGPLAIGQTANDSDNTKLANSSPVLPSKPPTLPTSIYPGLIVPKPVSKKQKGNGRVGATVRRGDYLVKITQNPDGTDKQEVSRIYSPLEPGSTNPKKPKTTTGELQAIASGVAPKTGREKKTVRRGDYLVKIEQDKGTGANKVELNRIYSPLSKGNSPTNNLPSSTQEWTEQQAQTNFTYYVNSLAGIASALASAKNDNEYQTLLGQYNEVYSKVNDNAAIIGTENKFPDLSGSSWNTGTNVLPTGGNAVGSGENGQQTVNVEASKSWADFATESLEGNSTLIIIGLAVFGFLYFNR